MIDSGKRSKINNSLTEASITIKISNNNSGTN
jgi:hypothetical protein